MKSRTLHSWSGHEPPQCLGIDVWVWCIGCNRQHRFVFKCPEHGGPQGVFWEGDPYSDPPNFPPTPSSSNSLQTYWVNEDGKQVNCHSFIKNGQWEYLGDCTAHNLRGLYDMVDLPDWLAGRSYDKP